MSWLPQSATFDAREFQILCVGVEGLTGAFTPSVVYQQYEYKNLAESGLDPDVIRTRLMARCRQIGCVLGYKDAALRSNPRSRIGCYQRPTAARRWRSAR